MKNLLEKLDVIKKPSMVIKQLNSQPDKPVILKLC